MAKKKMTKQAPKRVSRRRAVTEMPSVQDAAAPPPTEELPAEKPMPRTRFSDEELAEFQRLLIDKRAELVGDVNHMTSEALRNNQPGGAGNLSSMPIHMADIGTDNWERDFTLNLLESERQLLKEIDAALERINERTYGVCEATRKPIRKQRLRAKPWARYCIEYARLRELGRVP